MGTKLRTLTISVALVFGISTNSQGWSYNDFSDNAIPSVNDDFRQFLAAGTIIPRLPTGALPVIVEGTCYYLANGIWFLPVRKSSVQFMVVMAPV